jgi:hypothetical protein
MNDNETDRSQLNNDHNDHTNDSNTVGKQNTQCFSDFHCDFIFHFAKRLPSIAIQAFYCGLGIEFLKKLAIKDIPVLFLDTYERTVTSKYPVLNNPLTKLARSEKDCCFPEIIEIREKGKKLEVEYKKKGQLKLSSRLKILEMCLKMEAKRSKAQYDNGVDRDYYPTLAFLKSALLIGSYKKDLSPPSLGKMIYDYEKAVFSRDVDNCPIPNELAAFVVRAILSRIEITDVVLFDSKGHFPRSTTRGEGKEEEEKDNDEEREFVRKSSSVKKVFGGVEARQASSSATPGTGASHSNSRVLALDQPLNDEITCPADLGHIEVNINGKRQKAIANRKEGRSGAPTPENSSCFSGDINFILNNSSEFRDESRGLVDRTTYYSLIEILTNPNVYSASIHNLNGLDRTIQFISKIDRLPASDSLEALKMLQDAWDHVEQYDRYANYYKYIANFCYVLLLLLSIGVTISTLLALTDHKNKDTTISSRYNLSVVVISFITLAIIAVVSYFNPAFRWPQLRTAALQIRSHIYLFRTRAGPYRLTAGHIDEDEYADRVFREALSEIKRSVLEGADVRLTTLFSTFDYPNHHNQHFEAFAPTPTLTCWGLVFVLRRWLRTFCITLFCGRLRTMYGLINEWVSEKDHIDEGIRTVLDNRGTQDSQDDDEFPMDESDQAGQLKVLQAIRASSMSRKKSVQVFVRQSMSEQSISSLEKNKSVGKAEGTNSNGNEGEGTNFEDTKADEKVACEGENLSKMIVNDKISLDTLIQTINHNKEIYSPIHYQKERFYEPLTPDLYLKFRVEKALVFYRDRVHTCVFYRFISKIILVAGSILIIGLSFFENMVTWTAAITIVTASVSALLEFHDTTNKLERYNITVESLEKIRLWWQSIPEIEHSSVDNIDKLVLTCEDVLQREQQAWKASTSHMIKMWEKAMKDEKSGNNSSSTDNKAGGTGKQSNQQFNKSGIAPV